MVSGTEHTRVLVVDDEVLVVRLLSRTLQAAGHDVSVATDATEALDLVRRAPPDLVLLDVNLPGGNGFEVCRELRNDPATAAVPIVLLSGNDSEAQRTRALEAGATEFLAKPFDRAAIVACVARCARHEPA